MFASTGRTPRPPLSRRKRWLFRLAALAMSWLVIEACSLSALWLLHSGWGPVQRRMDSESRAEPLGNRRIGESDEVLHPFVGYVRRPLEQTRQRGTELGVTDFGYVDTGPPLHTRAPDRVIVGILGGSVAEELATRAWRSLERELRKSPAVADRKIVFVRLALSGYKQPQQLMTIGYLLALGGQFDVLINLDGYNDVVLPMVENSPAEVFPGYPRVWQARITETSDLTVLRRVGRVAYMRERSQHFAAVCGTPPLRWSPTASLVWASLDASMQRSINSEFAAVNQLKLEDHDFAVTGPPVTFAGPAEYYQHCADLWQRSSWQLHQLCEANGIQYFHFLQPNQYLPGSKPVMGPDERRQAYGEGHWGRIPVEQGYPLLVREGAGLAARGVRFCDLTPLFVDHPEQVYEDPCCHLNDHGNEVMVQRMGEFMRPSLHARSPGFSR